MLNFNPQIPSKQAAVAGKKRDNQNGWKADLIIRADWGSDISSSFGMMADASDGFDAKYDYPDPPLPPSGKYLTGYFEHSGWSKNATNYDRDIRKFNENGARWGYKIKSSNKGLVRISWNIQKFPEGNSLILINRETNTVIDMLAQSSFEFNYQGITEFEILLNNATSVNKNQALPVDYAISQNYPNPFNPVTTINYQLPKESHVTISVFNLRGQLVETLISSKQPAGYYQVNWNASGAGTGMYLYRIVAGDYRAVKKCIVVK